MWRAVLWWAAFLANLILLGISILAGVGLMQLGLVTAQKIPGQGALFIGLALLALTSVLSLAALFMYRHRPKRFDASVFT